MATVMLEVIEGTCPLAGEAAPAPAGLTEQIRERVAATPVDELGVELTTPDALDEAVAAARACGRPLRVFAATLTDLPPVLPGEHWAEEDLAGEPTWVLRFREPATWRLAVKRTLDLLVAVPLLVLVSPVIAVLAILVATTSSGGPFYRWRVLGQNGRPFTGYKLRTMYQDADARKAELIAQNQMVGPVFKIADDPRVTPLGRFLRKYSLDELPQLWSVVTGDMSLVGPRPVFPHEYQQFELWQLRKLTAKPGMTCIWQVSGRNQINQLDEWVRLDLEYIDAWSLGLDARILFQTCRAVLGGTGV